MLNIRSLLATLFVLGGLLAAAVSAGAPYMTP